jgi:carboxyl-terminal processing protease
LVAKGVLNKFALNYVEDERKNLTKKFPPKKEHSFADFNANFEITDDLLQKLVDAGVQEKVEYNEEQFLQSKNLIKLQLKALIVNDLWGINEYHQIMNEANESYLKAVEFLQNPELYNKALEKK